jgi:peptidoglycan/LPS O-acetylase OafA/YrhL
MHPTASVTRQRTKTGIGRGRRTDTDTTRSATADSPAVAAEADQPDELDSTHSTASVARLRSKTGMLNKLRAQWGAGIGETNGLAGTPKASDPSQPDGSPPGQSGAAAHQRPRIAGLDGLRAVAVAMVVVYHFLPNVLPAGFLGVDLFFALSGFLITGLLVGEIQATGRLRLGAFYGRRVRRLAPSVVVLVLAVVVASEFIWPDLRPTLRGSVLSSFCYVTNWWLIHANQSYFMATARPPMLEHLWSLAVEEQFYLVWPLAIGAVTGAALGRRKPARRAASDPAALDDPGTSASASGAAAGPDLMLRLAGLALLLTAASGAAMAYFAISTDVPYSTDSSRLYFGSDTHCMALFAGAAAAALVHRRRTHRKPTGTTVVRLADVAAVAVLVFVGYAALRWNEYTAAIYRTGFLEFGVAAAVLVALVGRPGSRVARVLDMRVLKAVGKRSYAIYLWHWPVDVVTRPGIDIHASAASVFMLRICLTCVLAWASYRWIEVPMRQVRLPRFGLSRSPKSGSESGPDTGLGAGLDPKPGLSPNFGVGLGSGLGLAFMNPKRAAAALATTSPRSLATRARGSLVFMLCVPVVISCILLGVVPAGPPPQVGDQADSQPVAAQVLPSTSASSASRAHQLSRSAQSQQQTQPLSAPLVLPVSPSPSPTPQQPSCLTSPAPASPGVSLSTPAMAFGDSVMLGAEYGLRSLMPNLSVYATVGLLPRPILARVRAMYEAGELPPVVIIHIGDNGFIVPSDLTSTLDLLRGRARVVLVTAKVPRDWQDAADQVVRQVAAQYPNVAVADWEAESQAQAGWFVSDGVHLTGPGISAFSQCIASAVAQ